MLEELWAKRKKKQTLKQRDQLRPNSFKINLIEVQNLPMSMNKKTSVKFKQLNKKLTKFVKPINLKI